MSRLIGLYPPRWRERYGEEFLALISERPPSLRDRVDIVRSAVDAHLSPQIPGPELVPDRTGFVPLIGFLTLVMGVVIGVTGPVLYDEYGSYRDGAAAVPFFVLAVALLGVGIARLAMRLSPSASWSRAVAAIAIGSGLLWSMAPWLVPLLLTFLVAVLVLAVGARQAGIWPTSLTVALFGLILLPVALFGAMMFLPWYAMREAGVAVLVLFAPLAGIWLVIGAGLLRGFQRRAEA